MKIDGWTNKSQLQYLKNGDDCIIFSAKEEEEEDLAVRIIPADTWDKLMRWCEACLCDVTPGGQEQDLRRWLSEILEEVEEPKP